MGNGDRDNGLKGVWGTWAMRHMGNGGHMGEWGTLAIMLDLDVKI